MARIYYRKIIAGQMILEQVPGRWREEVRKLLEENYDKKIQKETD